MARSSSERLRRTLVAELRGRGVIRSDRVEAAFLTVARERFLADVVGERGLKAVYRDEAIVVKRNPSGLPCSSSSQPSLMAEMLELLDLQPGHRVLEIGAGTGYNAALLAHIVGSRGRVTSVDVDADLARRARRSVRDAGYRATIKVGDGRQGHPAAAPYDRIVVTACADEIPRPWLDQLAEGGRLELPLRLDPDGAAIQVIPVLVRRGGRLHSVGLTWGGFMPLHGGDGGWRPSPAALGASRSVRDRHMSLASISGTGLNQLSDAAARALLASILTESTPPHRQGVTDLGSHRPPLLLLYLLLSIPAGRRVSLSHGGRLGIGIIHPGSQGLAVVSLRSPWGTGEQQRGGRARWRLDAYGSDSAAAELDQRLDEWQELQRAGRTQLRITARGRVSPLRLSFAWCHSYSNSDDQIRSRT